MGRSRRMECYKRDAYHAPRLACFIFYLLIYLFTFYLFNLLSDRSSFGKVLACFRYFLSVFE